MAEIIWRGVAWCRTGLAILLAKVVSSCFGDQLGKIGEGMTSQIWREDLARILSKRFGRWVGVFGERMWRECSPKRFVGVDVEVGGTLARRGRGRSLVGLERLNVQCRQSYRRNGSDSDEL